MFWQRGESVMKDKQKDSEDMNDQKNVQEKFESLPLNEKLSSLFKMELVTISEAVNYVVKDPMRVAEKIGDIITDFGIRVEKEFSGAAAKGSGEPPKPDTEGSTKKTRSRRATGPNSPST